ncbi:DUF4386 domain-containing protein [Nocardioides sp. GXQ0305]|uniref:DUF4386 domain-containing protein n=1 Tax=Nocardioides sp. GXQ0305 TaxID=3423912 RepID=UPI003D7F02FB
MTATTVPTRSAGRPDRASEASPERLARLTGALYVLLVVLGMLGPLTLESMLVPGDAAATADNITAADARFELSLVAWVVIVAVDVAISVTLYLILAPVSRAQSLVAAAFRLVYSAALAALLALLFVAGLLLSEGTGRDTEALLALETFSAGFLAALVFFGLHLVLLGSLFYRSRYIPRVLGVLLVAAGIGYVIDSLASLVVEGYGGVLAVVLLTPAVLGEVGLTLWLLVKGVAVPGPSEDRDSAPRGAHGAGAAGG